MGFRLCLVVGLEALKAVVLVGKPDFARLAASSRKCCWQKKLCIEKRQICCFSATLFAMEYGIFFFLNHLILFWQRLQISFKRSIQNSGKLEVTAT